MPPRLATVLLRLFLHAEDAEVVAGDFEEIFAADIVPRIGVRAARRWYWRQVASVILRQRPGTRRRPSIQSSSGGTMAAVRQDIGYALRTLRNQPGFAAVAVLTLALGIGANIAMFSLMHAVMWKPLPFDNPAQLMLVHMLRPDRDAPGTYVQARWSYPKYQVFKHSQQVFESTAIVLEAEWNLTGAGSPIRVPGERVDSSYFQVLGARPQLGRVFDAAETASPASSPIAVISDGLWRRRFGADGGVVGKTLDLGGIPHTILGVLAPRFHGFTGQADVWVPVTTQPAKILLEPWSHNYRLVARRKHGVPVDQVPAALEMASAAVDRAFPTQPMMFGGCGGSEPSRSMTSASIRCFAAPHSCCWPPSWRCC